MNNIKPFKIQSPKRILNSILKDKKLMGFYDNITNLTNKYLNMGTKIEWCDHTWNPIGGCSHISSGCDNCYAEKMATRISGIDPKRKYKTCITAGKWNGNVSFFPDELDKPAKFKKPSRIFVCSMGDLFHENVPSYWIDKVFDTIWYNPQHTYILLTKRPLLAENYFKSAPSSVIELAKKHVWFGFTAENQAEFDLRFGISMHIPAAKHFVSLEPSLGQISFVKKSGQLVSNALTGEWGENKMITKIDWVIMGGETGPNARPLHPDWVKLVKDQCQDAGTPFFFKSWGEWTWEKKPEVMDEPTCMVCGCTEDHTCEGGCHWHVYNEEKQYYICSNCGRVHVTKMEDESLMYRIGKKRSGRSINGVIYNQFPQ